MANLMTTDPANTMLLLLLC